MVDEAALMQGAASSKKGGGIMTDPVNREEFLKNQKEYCERKKAPFFMPGNGMCYRCRQDIIPALIKKGGDGNTLVTGCPLCLWSYCD